MTVNKKVVIAFSILTAVLIIAVVSLSAVLAAFQANTGGGFNISYTAVNVNATISGKYQYGTGAATSLKYTVNNVENTTITFNNSDNANSVTRMFDTVTIDDLGVNDLYIWYQIRNTGSSAIKITGSVTETANDNLKVQYYCYDGFVNKEPEDFMTTYNGTWVDSLTHTNIFGANGKNLNSHSSLSAEYGCWLFMKISIENKTQNVTNGNLQFNFNLTVA